VVVIVTGGRDYSDPAKLYEVLDGMLPVEELIQGGASGADKYASEWAVSRGIACRTYKANWDKFGKTAGPIRNRIMLEENKLAVLVAFPGGAGTANCVRVAKSLGIKVIEIER
jgi:hypothetical protein